jgi:hypothetical protein
MTRGRTLGRFGRPPRGKPVARSECPRCARLIASGRDSPADRRMGYSSHLRLTHADLSPRERSLLADQMLLAEVPYAG